MIKKISRLPVLIFLFVLSAALSNCATVPQSQALRGIEVGMDKSDVLEKVGNPAHKTRQLGQDRWTYEVDKANGDHETIHVFFDEGKVTYIGPSEPTPTASSASGAKKSNKSEKDSFKPVGEGK